MRLFIADLSVILYLMSVFPVNGASAHRNAGLSAGIPSYCKLVRYSLAEPWLMQRRPRRAARAVWPDLVVSTDETSDAILAAVENGQLKALSRPLYSPALEDEPAVILRRNAWKVVAALVPGAVISFRTALDARPADDGSVFLVSTGRYQRDLPGLKIRAVAGPGPLPGDNPFIDGLYLASRPRAMLEALRPSRARGTVARGLAPQGVESRLEKDFQTGGERALNTLRDTARELADVLNAADEYAVLDRLIGQLLGTRPDLPTTPSAVARRAGRPYDVERLALFETLSGALQDVSGTERRCDMTSPQLFATMAFFDAYFSNFIEGTEFEVDEARAIVFDQVIPTVRPLDAHDILGTFAVVGQRTTMQHSVRDDRDAGAFIARLQALHGRIMEQRKDTRPGLLKQERNRVGDTRFVQPERVIGTLEYGYQITRALATPFQRAVAIMFVLSEIHPFDDGNGRLARAFMNAELIAGGEARIIIPTVYCDDYLTALRTLSRAATPQPLIQVLDFAQRWVAMLDWTSLSAAEASIAATNAFARPSTRDVLRLPNAHAAPASSAPAVVLTMSAAQPGTES